MMWWLLACSVQESEKIENIPSEEPLPDITEEVLDQGTLDPSQDTQGRVVKRMRVDQVRDSMEQITGTVWGNNNSKWDLYAQSLGVPDYQQRMTEDRSPSVMFQKFLNDAATESCAEWMEADTDMFVADATSLETSDVLSNIEHLRWLIQGHAKGGEAAILQDYTALHQSVWVRTDSTDEAWHTVCVALFTHPDFWMY
ncbi:MAG: hypothetical protein VX278_12600 [Myxococcota bacterium]|nr:hypothetical protein [Myxococcota bacterium]